MVEKRSIDPMQIEGTKTKRSLRDAKEREAREIRKQKERCAFSCKTELKQILARAASSHQQYHNGTNFQDQPHPGFPESESLLAGYFMRLLRANFVINS